MVIRFSWSSGVMVCRAAPELAETVRTEVAWRCAAMLERAAAAPKRRYPEVMRARDVPSRYGACSSCGDELPHYRAGDCELCRGARYRAAERIAR